jgi:type IV secretory pathway VirB4 component
MIRQKLATHEERYFETGMYMTIYETEQEKIRESSKKIEQKLSGLSLRNKPATFRMDDGMVSSLPLCVDNLGITRSTITSSLAGSFPFISQDIIHKTGVLYGINLHTG